MAASVIVRKNSGWDDILSYQTVKIVLINDRKLGILHYVLMLIIIVYVIGYTVVYEKRYVTTQAPIGSVRLSLLAPPQRTNPTSLPYCLTNNTHPIPSHNTSIPKNMTFPCVYYDDKLVLLPNPIQESSIFFATRITTTTQTLNHSCSLFESTCVYVDEHEENLYVADIENFTIMIDHTISDTFNVGDVIELNGVIYDAQGNVMTLKKPDQFGQKGVFDILQVGTLLRAAGVDSLDELSTNRPFLTKRYEGLLIILLIEYSNMFSYDLTDTQYFVSASVIPKAYFKVEQPIYSSTNSSLNSRTIWNRHGVRMIVIQNGTLGRFDFPTMLLSFVSGLGLIAVATLIVDILATKILPHRDEYRKYKYASTNDGNGNGKDLPSPPESLEYGTFGRKFESVEYRK